MNSKAISPMVATVLLIAFTVAIGGIINLWMTGFTATTTSSVESASTNTTKCAGTYIEVISVTTDGIIITNRGSEGISNINCYMSNGTRVVSLTNVNLTSGTSTGGNWTRGNQTSVICSGSCLNVGVTGECKSGQSCWRT